MPSVPLYHLHWLVMLPLLKITFGILHSCWKNLGQRLYTLYSTPLGNGAEADLAALFTSWTSFQHVSIL